MLRTYKYGVSLIGKIKLEFVLNT